MFEGELTHGAYWKSQKGTEYLIASSQNGYLAFYNLSLRDMIKIHPVRSTILHFNIIKDVQGYTHLILHLEDYYLALNIEKKSDHDSLLEKNPVLFKYHHWSSYFSLNNQVKTKETSLDQLKSYLLNSKLKTISRWAGSSLFEQLGRNGSISTTIGAFNIYERAIFIYEMRSHPVEIWKCSIHSGIVKSMQYTSHVVIIVVAYPNQSQEIMIISLEDKIPIILQKLSLPKRETIRMVFCSRLNSQENAGTDHRDHFQPLAPFVSFDQQLKIDQKARFPSCLDPLIQCKNMIPSHCSSSTSLQFPDNFNAFHVPKRVIFSRSLPKLVIVTCSSLLSIYQSSPSILFFTAIPKGLRNSIESAIVMDLQTWDQKEAQMIQILANYYLRSNHSKLVYHLSSCSNIPLKWIIKNEIEGNKTDLDAILSLLDYWKAKLEKSKQFNDESRIQMDHWKCLVKMNIYLLSRVHWDGTRNANKDDRLLAHWMECHASNCDSNLIRPVLQRRHETINHNLSLERKDVHSHSFCQELTHVNNGSCIENYLGLESAFNSLQDSPTNMENIHQIIYWITSSCNHSQLIHLVQILQHDIFELEPLPRSTDNDQWRNRIEKERANESLNVLEETTSKLYCDPFSHLSKIHRVSKEVILIHILLQIRYRTRVDPGWKSYLLENPFSTIDMVIIDNGYSTLDLPLNGHHSDGQERREAEVFPSISTTSSPNDFLALVRRCFIDLSSQSPTFYIPCFHNLLPKCYSLEDFQIASMVDWLVGDPLACLNDWINCIEIDNKIIKEKSLQVTDPTNPSIVEIFKWLSILDHSSCNRVELKVFTLERIFFVGKRVYGLPSTPDLERFLIQTRPRLGLLLIRLLSASNLGEDHVLKEIQLSHQFYCAMVQCDLEEEGKERNKMRHSPEDTEMEESGHTDMGSIIESVMGRMADRKIPSSLHSLDFDPSLSALHGIEINQLKFKAAINKMDNQGQVDQGLVAFTCGHIFTNIQFNQEIIPEFVRRMNEPIVDATPSLIQRLLQEFHSEELIHLACPFCTFNSLIEKKGESSMRWSLIME